MTLLMGESLGMEAPLANDVALVAIKTPKANLHARTEQSGRLTLTTLRLSSKCIRGKFGDVTTLNVVSQGIEGSCPVGTRTAPVEQHPSASHHKAFRSVAAMKAPSMLAASHLSWRSLFSRFVVFLAEFVAVSKGIPSSTTSGQHFTVWTCRIGAEEMLQSASF